jgi:glutaminyl-tRNA synthetase
VILDDNGEVKELICSYVPESKSGSDTSGIKVKGVIQWVNEADAVDVEIRQYGHLLKDEEYAGQDFSERMNTESVKIFNGKVEPYIFENDRDASYQLIRTGYFKRLTVNGKEVVSEIVSLKDNYNIKK